MAVTERRALSRKTSRGSVGETLVVGAGLAGAVMARRIADHGERVLVVDKREHVAGNCYDHADEHGVWVHAYGPHVFHSNAEKVWRWLSRFTEWRPYEQRVLARVGDELYPFPINRTTLERFLGVSLPTSEAAGRYLEEQLAEPLESVRTSEDVCVARFGRELYEAFFRGYCNPPEAPILMSNLDFKSLGEIQVGDEVVGWRGGKHKESGLVPSTVLAVNRCRKPMVRVLLASGRTIRCSPDHDWLQHYRSTNGRIGPRGHDERFDVPKVGRVLCNAVEQPEDLTAEQRRAAAWLGGIYDGEGSCDAGGIAIAQSQSHNPDVFTEIQRVLDLLGFAYSVQTRADGKTGGFRLLGGRRTTARFVQLCQPIRRHRAIKTVLCHRWRSPDEIVAVEPDGEDEAIGLTTTTGNYIAWGFASKNTRKQWALDPSELDRSVCARIPIRTDRDDRYFTDEFQAVPVDGYTAMVERILDHPLIGVELGTDGLALMPHRTSRVVWTGPVDELWDYCLGRLPYRSLKFELRSRRSWQLVQPVAGINYPDADVPWTRDTEFRHITGQAHEWTTIMREFPSAEGDPYYPVPADQNRLLYRRYARLTEREMPNVILVGRLARYQYVNMDQVVAQALVASRGIVGEPVAS